MALRHHETVLQQIGSRRSLMLPDAANANEIARTVLSIPVCSNNNGFKTDNIEKAPPLLENRQQATIALPDFLLLLPAASEREYPRFAARAIDNDLQRHC